MSAQALATKKSRLGGMTVRGQKIVLNTSEKYHASDSIHMSFESFFSFLFIVLHLYLVFVSGIMVSRVFVQRNSVKQRKREHKYSFVLIWRLPFQHDARHDVAGLDHQHKKTKVEEFECHLDDEYVVTQITLVFPPRCMMTKASEL